MPARRSRPQSGVHPRPGPGTASSGTACRRRAYVLQPGLGEMSGLLLGGPAPAPQRALDAGYRFRFPDLDAALADLLVADKDTA